MPATFTVQSDAGDVQDANAYIDVAYFRQYHLDRGRDLAAKTDDQVKTGIVLATDYIDNRWRLQFAGQQKTQLTFVQSTEWPRDNAAYENGVDIVGLPVPLKKACAEYALRAVNLGQLVADAPAPINEDGEQTSGIVLETSVEVGGAITESKKYAEYRGSAGGTVSTDGCLLPQIPAADMLIERLLDGSSIQRRVIRS